MPAVAELAATTGVRPACQVLQVPPASYYRWRQRAAGIGVKIRIAERIASTLGLEYAEHPLARGS
jgi:hypothetical protein